jgi:DNA repair protein RecN (Recombination protein N)
VLLELRVQNLLLIERAELRLGPGLAAVTGETGAGKTVLAHALDLLLGGRPRSGIVRPGAEEAYVEGVFAAPPGLLDDDALADLRERLPEGDDEIVLGRRVAAGGRTRAFVQGRSATADDLRELGGRLVAFYGQHEHRRLTVGSAQLGVLDRFLGAEHVAACRELAAAHRRAASLARELAAVRERDGARERDRDLLVFELEEIDALAPTDEDRERLMVERERLRGSDALRAAAGVGAEAIAPEGADAPGVAALLAASEHEAQAVAALDPELAALAGRLEALRIEADDLGAELRRYSESLEADPERLEEVDGRLDQYERLERKHGGSVERVLAHAERCRAELAALDDSGASQERLQAEFAEATRERDIVAARVSAARERGAPDLAARVRTELGDLAMEDASFEVRLDAREEVGAAGAERVEFMIAPNAGVPLAPLRETASGGELSRTMLALMTAANEGVAAAAEDGGSIDAGAPTLVFDEVDAGIGGQTARAVGERLRRLAAGRQVICITHLPQIASLAERHFRIEKEGGAEVARTTVESLQGDAVVTELCRMLGAEADDAGARRHAEELLGAAA